MADLRSIQLVTQDTQDTQDTQAFHIISPQFKFMAYGRWQAKTSGVKISVPFRSLFHIDKSLHSPTPLACTHYV
ncbi:MAG: hypothetical protein EZS28_009623 [Streblomastix strix]|uniref:Uncharacterized protein n=1 Tax=Streblomastix strix TaxID=222440 RepID=A0A5J4WID7_9EUKA|nr:MAG: hypothetical protein EZS28_009623 [Streblomastix strix]